MRPPRVERVGSEVVRDLLGQRAGGDAGGPDEGADRDTTSVGELDDLAVGPRDAHAENHLHAATRERATGHSRQARREAREQTVGGFDEHDPCSPDVQRREVLDQHAVEQLDEPSCQLDAGRAAARDHDVEEPVVDERAVDRHPFELVQDPGTQGQGIGEVLQTERVLRHARDAVGRGDRSGREHELVVLQRRPLGEVHGPAVEVDVGHGSQPHVDVPRLASHDSPDRMRDVVAVESGGRDLVEQWLERVEVVRVDEHDVDRHTFEGPDQRQPSEARPDHDHPMTSFHVPDATPAPAAPSFRLQASPVERRAGLAPCERLGRRD